MDQKKRAILALVLVGAVVPFAIFLAARGSHEHRIAQHGADAEGTIVRMIDQHETRHDHRPLMRITVEGDWADAHRTSHADRRIDDDEITTFVVGARVAIRYDREDPNTIVVLRAVPPDPTPPPSAVQ